MRSVKSSKSPILVPLMLRGKGLLKFALATSIVLALWWSTKQAHAQSLNFERPDFVDYHTKSFSVQVPDYLVQVNDLSDDALLQMKNIFNETYLIVAPEQKTETLGLEELSNRFEAKLSNYRAVITSVEKIKIGSSRAVQYAVKWTVDEVPLVYLITFVETPKTIFKIYGWTLASQTYLLDHFKKTAASFLPCASLQCNRMP